MEHGEILQADLPDEDPFLISVSNEIFSRKRYVPKVQIVIEEFDRILAPYDLKKDDYVHCGLNGCTKEHGRGFLFRLKDGRESNCGKDCGNREFDAEFDRFTTDFYSKKQAFDRKQVVLKAKQESEPLLANAILLRDKVVFFAKAVNQILNDCIYRDPAIQRRFEDSLSNGGIIQKEEKIDQAFTEERGRQSQYRSVTVARIEGGGAYRSAGSSVSRLDDSVIATFKEIAALDSASIGDDEAASLSMRIAESRRALQAAIAFVKNAEKFCSVANLSAMRSIWEVMPAKSNRAERALRSLQRIIDSKS